jgi:uncharacterized membrane protein
VLSYACASWLTPRLTLTETTSKSRLEAFSDGVIAILITIMVLDLRVPAGSDLGALADVLPTLGLYILSFAFLGIYWNNHHHLLHTTTRVNGTVLWANLHLLFWLSLVRFATRWMGESGLAPVPTAGYGGVLFLSGLAFTILVRTILACQPPESVLATAIGSDRRRQISGLTPRRATRTWYTTGSGLVRGSGIAPSWRPSPSHR